MKESRAEIIESYPDEQPILLSHVTSTLGRYRIIIALSIAGIVLAYLMIAATAYLLATSQTIASSPFRLEFSGADLGQYPNGLKFSVADITSNPVLLEVYDANDLKRFVGFEPFSRAIYVLEANRALERLTAEYQAKLADTKLTPVDRERLEREYESKRAGISKSEYAIQFMTNDATRRIPASLVRKVLADLLAVWARRAAIEKKVLEYQVPILSANILADTQVSEGDYLIPLLLLRRRVDDVAGNLTSIGAIPGAELVRTSQGKVSVEELRLRLDEIVRFRLEPLIAAARAAGHLGADGTAQQILKAQLAYDERALTATRMREEALRNALLTYESQPRTTEAVGTQTGIPRGTESGSRGAGETVMPQLSDTFLDRIVDLTSRNADRDYRQKLTEEIKNASLAIIPVEATVRYDRELIDALQHPVARPDAAAAPALKREYQTIVDQLRTIVAQMNEIHHLASRQLNPSTELYRVTGPTVFRIERSISPRRLALGGMLVFLIAIPLVIAGVLLHNRIREEEAMEHAASTEAPA